MDGKKKHAGPGVRHPMCPEVGRKTRTNIGPEVSISTITLVSRHEANTKRTAKGDT